MLLIVAILLDYFLKNNVEAEKSVEVFRYMLDHALNTYSLRITDFDVQRILLKREVRFLFLLLSLLGQVSKSLDHSLFDEIYKCSQRFIRKITAKSRFPDTLKEWLSQSRQDS